LGHDLRQASRAATQVFGCGYSVFFGSSPLDRTKYQPAISIFHWNRLLFAARGGRYTQTGSGNRTVLRSGHPPHLFFACGIDRAYIVFAAKEETELRTEFTAVRVLRGPHRETRFVIHVIKWMPMQGGRHQQRDRRRRWQAESKGVKMGYGVGGRVDLCKRRGRSLKPSTE